MGRPKLTYERRRLRLDGYLPVDDPLLKQIEALPARTRFPTVIRLLRMGQALDSLPKDVGEEERKRQVEAALDIMSAFVVDDI